MITQVACCDHCVHKISETIRTQGGLQIEGSVVTPSVVDAPKVSQTAKKDSGILSGLTYYSGKVASIFAASTAPKLVESSCSTLAMKTVFALKDIKELPSGVMKFYSSLSDTITLSQLKEELIKQFTVGTLAECSTCAEAAKNALFTMPSYAFLAACATDMIASEVFGLFFGSSWITTILQAGTSFYASSYFCGNTLGEVKELAIGYMAFRVLSGVWSAISCPSKK